MPLVSNDYAQYVSQGLGLDSRASMRPDGRISLEFDFKNKLPELFPTITKRNEVEEFAVDKDNWKVYPPMNIVIMIVGSRGDVQPYVALGQQLVKDGHRVRIATHETFRAFVTDAGLEFFNIGGNPQDLMSYMVKNPGLIPGFESLTNGDIILKRKMLDQMINGCWLACHRPCTASGRDFVADAIISNPPAFAHIHCAEALGIPLLLSFTMPWSPTTAFSHPLVKVTTSNIVAVASGMSNYLSYAGSDLLTWKGVGDIVNDFREKVGLEKLGLRSGPGYLDRLQLPWTYCMSPALVPKPRDWKDNTDVVGFYFLDLATNYTPPPELVTFLAAGDTPIYIGFGSVVVDDPAEMSNIIFQATEQAGVRALVSSGWGGLGGVSVPPHVFMLGNIPHDWLFDQERVRAVVHHGGAGTTAIGLAKGRPTVVVPFFGDQGFWGAMIYKAGAGPKPIPQKELNVEKLRDAVKYAISPAAKESAKRLAERIYVENGVRNGANSFYKHLPLLNMRCDLDPARLAAWWSKELCLKLSAFAAQILSNSKLISLNNLILHRSKNYKSIAETESKSIWNDGASSFLWALTHETKLGDLFQSTTSEEPHYGIKDAMTSVHDGLHIHDISHSKHSKGRASWDHQGPSLKTLLEGHKKRLRSIPIQGSWKMARSDEGLNDYNRMILFRISEGKQAVLLSTEDQRAHVLKRFSEEVSNTSKRRNLYHAAVEMERNREASKDARAEATANHEDDSKPSISLPHESSTPSVLSVPEVELSRPEVKTEDIEDPNFLHEMALAMKLSREIKDDEHVNENPDFEREMEQAIKLSGKIEYGKYEDPNFLRDMELAMKLSLDNV